MALLSLALILDLFIGDPPWLWKRLPHPVVMFGRVISAFDNIRKKQNAGEVNEDGDEPGFLFGVLLLIFFAVICVAVSAAVWRLQTLVPIAAYAVELFLVAVLIAQKSLHDHVKAVAVALREGGLQEGREAVSMIVGRDVSRLEEGGVSKAAIESLAENFSDGVVAPVVWYALLGLPGILFYKAVNTADSMIGHRTSEYEQFGKPAAILDDWMNWPAARFSSVLVVIAVAIGRGKSAAQNVWSITRQDAPAHRSPNAGWPETSFAVALNLALGGARNYGNDVVDGAVLNSSGRSNAGVADIEKALSLLLRSCICLIALCIFLWFAFGR